MATEIRHAAVSAEMVRSRRRKFLVTWFWKGLALLVLAAVSVFILFPALWMVSTSLKPDDQVAMTNWIPRPVVWSNYAKALKSIPFARYTLNTATYALIVVVADVVSNSLVAYGFAKLRFPGRNLLFGVVLATMMIPGMVTMIPQYILFAKLHWIPSYLPLVVPHFFSGAFFVFLIRQFYMGIPEEYSEAARIDGAGEFWIYSRIIVPLAKPVLATVAIFSFEGAWNEYIGAVLYLSNNKMYTLQVGLTMFRSTSDTQWQHLMAASIVVMLPIIILFTAFQKYFVEGAAVSGIKG
ncbi:MAG TPA: carbohydrate ABC transporter permease [Symbiobacteriaceae bacterium]|nr:carbohydrate ABC transporter permease [Symbiobacteriaceae bacterium]